MEEYDQLPWIELEQAWEDSAPSAPTIDLMLNRRVTGFTITENLGIAVVNARSVQAGAVLSTGANGEVYWTTPPQQVGAITPRQEIPILPRAERDRIIQEQLSQPEGRAHLARAMVEPLRMRREYDTLGRRTLLVEQLPNNALPTYDRDPDVRLLIAPEDP
jgi:hypothetical protein